METINIVTKGKAMKMLSDSLFTPGGTLTRMKLFTGKFHPESKKVGEAIEVPEGVKAVYTETRKDEYGKYKLLYCLIK